MCGLIGIYDRDKKLTVTERKEIMKSGLFVSSLRGTHNTGMYTHSGQVGRVYKSDLASPEWVSSYNASSAALTSAGNSMFTIGHVRAASAGMARSVESAHPYDVEHIVLAHNGTLKPAWRSKINGDWDVDSKALAHAIATDGLEWVIENIEGAMSLVWYNETENSLNFYRNNERPMVFASIEDHEDVFIYGSELPFLEFSASRAGLSISESFDLDPNTSIKFDLDTGYNEVKTGYTQFVPPKAKHFNYQSSYTSPKGRLSLPSTNYNKQQTSHIDIVNRRLNVDLNIQGKEHGDRFLFWPMDIEGHSKSDKCILRGYHAWMYDSDITSEVLDYDQPIVIYGIDRELSEALISTSLVVSSKLQSVIAMKNVGGFISWQLQLNSSNLQVHDVTGGQDAELNSFHSKLEETTGYKNHMKIPEVIDGEFENTSLHESDSLPDDIDDNPYFCEFCSLEIDFSEDVFEMTGDNNYSYMSSDYDKSFLHTDCLPSARQYLTINDDEIKLREAVEVIGIHGKVDKCVHCKTPMIEGVQSYQLDGDDWMHRSCMSISDKGFNDLVLRVYKR